MTFYANQKQVNLSKAFDTLNHNLLCKQKGYGIDRNALTFIQKTKVGHKLK